MSDDILGRTRLAEILDPEHPELTGFARGDCLYLVETNNDHAWLEGRAVCLGDMV
jgi:hypothetical protein